MGCRKILMPSTNNVGTAIRIFRPVSPDAIDTGVTSHQSLNEEALDCYTSESVTLPNLAVAALSTEYKVMDVLHRVLRT